MTFLEYQAEALRTLQPDADALYVFTKMMIEASEAAQAIIKHKYHGKPVDFEYVMGELGDVQWYLAAAAELIGTTLEEVAQRNITKLRGRHGDSYNPKFYRNGND